MELTSALEIASNSFRSLQYWSEVSFEEGRSCSPIEALIWCSHDLGYTASAVSKISRPVTSLHAAGLPPVDVRAVRISQLCGIPKLAVVMSSLCATAACARRTMSANLSEHHESHSATTDSTYTSELPTFVHIPRHVTKSASTASPVLLSKLCNVRNRASRCSSSVTSRFRNVSKPADKGTFSGGV